MSQGPERAALGILVTGILFLVIFFNRGGKWKSTTKRRLGLVACSVAMLAGVAFLVRELAVLPVRPFDGVLTLVGVLAFFTTMALIVVGLLWPNEPEQP